MSYLSGGVSIEPDAELRNNVINGPTWYTIPTDLDTYIKTKGLPHFHENSKKYEYRLSNVHIICRGKAAWNHEKAKRLFFDFRLNDRSLVYSADSEMSTCTDASKINMEYIVNNFEQRPTDDQHLYQIGDIGPHAISTVCYAEGASTIQFYKILESDGATVTMSSKHVIEGLLNINEYDLTHTYFTIDVYIVIDGLVTLYDRLRRPISKIMRDSIEQVFELSIDDVVINITADISIAERFGCTFYFKNLELTPHGRHMPEIKQEGDAVIEMSSNNTSTGNNGAPSVTISIGHHKLEIPESYWELVNKGLSDERLVCNDNLKWHVKNVTSVLLSTCPIKIKVVTSDNNQKNMPCSLFANPPMSAIIRNECLEFVGNEEGYYKQGSCLLAVSNSPGRIQNLHLLHMMHSALPLVPMVKCVLVDKLKAKSHVTIHNYDTCHSSGRPLQIPCKYVYKFVDTADSLYREYTLEDGVSFLPLTFGRVDGEYVNIDQTSELEFELFVNCVDCVKSEYIYKRESIGWLRNLHEYIVSKDESTAKIHLKYESVDIKLQLLNDLKFRIVEAEKNESALRYPMEASVYYIDHADKFISRFLDAECRVVALSTMMRFPIDKYFVNKIGDSVEDIVLWTGHLVKKSFYLPLNNSIQIKQPNHVLNETSPSNSLDVSFLVASILHSQNKPVAILIGQYGGAGIVPMLVTVTDKRIIFIIYQSVEVTQIVNDDVREGFLKEFDSFVLDDKQLDYKMNNPRSFDLINPWNELQPEGFRCDLIITPYWIKYCNLPLKSAWCQSKIGNNIFDAFNNESKNWRIWHCYDKYKKNVRALPFLKPIFNNKECMISDVLDNSLQEVYSNLYAYIRAGAKILCEWIVAKSTEEKDMIRLKLQIWLKNFRIENTVEKLSIIMVHGINWKTFNIPIYTEIKDDKNLPKLMFDPLESYTNRDINLKGSNHHYNRTNDLILVATDGLNNYGDSMILDQYGFKYISNGQIMSNKNRTL